MSTAVFFITKFLAKEVGDGSIVSELLAGVPGWRGRTQQITALQNRASFHCYSSTLSPCIVLWHVQTTYVQLVIAKVPLGRL